MSDTYGTKKRYHNIFPQMYYIFCYHQSVVFKGHAQTVTMCMVKLNLKLFHSQQIAKISLFIVPEFSSS